MHDPFFDEDDGEFDDLYGNPRPSASSSSIKLETRKNETRVVPPVTPGSRPSTRSPLASSSVVSRSYVRDRAGSTTSNLTDLTASGKPDKRRKRRGRPRRKSSQELFDVQWESDIRVAKCGLCRADFSLVKRKHHCRHCGRVMCSDCSSFLYFELSHRKHRVCVPCNNQLLAEQDAYDRETLAGQRETGVMDNSSEDGHRLAAAMAPMSSTEKMRKNQDKKSEKNGQISQVTTPNPPPSRKPAEKKPSSSLFDGADDDWFTDVPKQQSSTRDSEDSDRGGSKGPGWRDRVKDTYTVTSASDAVLVPMAGSTLTAGITGNGYISDQFRYDVSGPGLGHEDDLSVAMPRPRQQTATTYADHSVKSSRLTGNGYYSEQFQYDVSGPGLGHDDDRSLAMPRPKQQTAAVPYSYDDTRQSVFSGTKPREATVKKEKKPRARGDESMTMDELNLSYSSEDEPRVAMPRPTATSVASTLYDKDADKLVVDDSPGFFEATAAEREAQRKKDEEQQRQLASDMAWVNSSALPPSVPAHRFSSGQESYSIVDLPSHTSNSPVESRQGRNAGEIVGNTKGGFTGALKRFFGMGSKEAKRTTTPPKTVKATPARPATEKSTDKHSEEKHTDDVVPDELKTVERHTVVDYHGATREDSAAQESFRYTMPASVVATGASEASMPARLAVSEEYEQVQPKTERKRRGTFDDLFESPKNNVGGHADRAANGWTARVGESTSAASAAPGVGVSRFDRRRSVDEADGFTLGDEPQPAQNSARTDDPIEAWRQSAAMSILNDRSDTRQSETSAFTWSNVRSTPALGTATFAVPTSLQPSASSPYESLDTQAAPLGNIMDDLNRNGTSKPTPGKESVDDFFAEFEEPNDYVFDPATGGYVAARVPPRAQQVKRLESPKSRADRDIYESLERDYNTPVVVSTAATITSKNDDGEEVEDEVAEIIVDKISSLESELAALKQLIRNRKGSGGSKPRVSHRTTRPSVRKESIFDNDSSEEEGGKKNDSVRPVAKRESKQRPPSKKKPVKKRRDSFADLFEDSPNEQEGLGGATSYEALFQTGAKTAEANNDEDSDDDAGLAPKSAKRRPKSRRRSSRKIKAFVPGKEGSNSEQEFTSLKGRRGKQSRRKESEKVEDTVANLTLDDAEEKLVTVSVVPVANPTKQTEEEDPIDALFDTSNDRDVAKLYGGDGLDERLSIEAKLASTLPSTSALLTQASSTSLTDDEPTSTAANMESVASLSQMNSGFSYSVDSLSLEEADEEEEFSINWAKMRKTKSRGRKSRKSGSSKTIGDATAEKSTEDTVWETSALDTNSEFKLDGSDLAVEGEVREAPASLADTTSNWMSVTTLEETDDDVDLKSLLQSEDGEPLETAESATKNEDERHTIADTGSPPVSIAAPSSSLNEVISAVEIDVPLSKVSSEESVEAYTSQDEREASFDVFDKSGDVSFLSASSSLDLKPLNHDGGSEDEEKESLSDDEAFSFEIKTPKKRSSVADIPTSIASNEPSLQSTPSDENVELGKYATSSIDGSLEDLEESPVDDEPVLGKVESQAFDTDWQQMQAKEKERKKRLQVKQRQAQRDKVLRKQGVSSKSLSNSSATPGSTKTKKKKKEKGKDDAASSSSHHKKSRKHRHRDKAEEASEPPRSLTEL
ncbi:FYVE zinc finger domain-containing protein [Phytophthora infestans]|uniref:FYVE zinc finger domain-containing protein n=1 Tax=Phytophthora infestans TaxID=4787 RepID=A0A833S8J9_PHYIN|nr:FYVE zinc finger domain-containing protein [Phytophthora infestans]KAF4128723.1 FYVE zinc finger domain-containing protein [Phytophthora infestans]